MSNSSLFCLFTFFILGKRYTKLDFLACVCMSVGLTLFVLADSVVQPNFNITGMTFVIE